MSANNVLQVSDKPSCHVVFVETTAFICFAYMFLFDSYLFFRHRLLQRFFIQNKYCVCFVLYSCHQSFKRFMSVFLSMC